MDSAGHIVDSMQYAFSITGFEPPSAAQIRQIIGLGLNEAVGNLAPTLDARVVEEVTEHYTAFS